MDDYCSEITNNVIDWTQQGLQRGWLSSKQAHTLNLATAMPSYDRNSNPGPLTIALLGGTGAGKSSLLNRLANDDIAHTSIARPTTKEITLYHHAALDLKHIAKTRPLDKIKIAHHANDAFQEIIFIDTPDLNNIKPQTLAWLAHLDILIYIVTPERYLDSKAWRILLNKRGGHAMIFIINHWDKSSEIQLDDFKKQLKKTGGFQTPVIYRTDCRTDKPATAIDEFDQLKVSLLSLSHSNAMKYLAQLNITLHLDAIHKHLQDILKAPGNNLDIDALLAQWKNIWSLCYPLLLMEIEQSIRDIAQRFAQRDSHPEKARQHNASMAYSIDQKTHQDTALELWTQSAKARLSYAVEQFIIELNIAQTPSKPFKIALENITNQAPQLVNELAEEYLISALVKPSALIQRSALKVAGVYSTTLLPLTSLKTEKTTRKGLRIGAQKALALLNKKIMASIEQTFTTQADYLSEGALLQALCKENSAHEKIQPNKLLARLLTQ